MTDIAPLVETLEHRWMRAWSGGDSRTLKALTSRNFRLVIGSKPCVMLDSKSFLVAARDSFLCHSYRFGDIYARELGSGVAVFATQLEMKATLAGEDWSGEAWLTAIWRKSRVRRRWKLVERVLSRPEASPQVPRLVRSMQLWR